MYCTKCGTQIGDELKCPNCGQPVQPVAQAPLPTVPAYIVWSILATLFCCLPGGVVAIIYSAMVGSKLAANDYEGALKASKKAKLWCWLSFGIGLAMQLIVTAIYVIMMFVCISQKDSSVLHL